MDWDHDVKPNWDAAKPSVQAKWPKFTEEDVRRMEGRKNWLEDRLHEVYGLSPAEQKKQIDEWFAGWKKPEHTPSEADKPSVERDVPAQPAVEAKAAIEYEPAVEPKAAVLARDAEPAVLAIEAVPARDAIVGVKAEPYRPAVLAEPGIPARPAVKAEPAVKGKAEVMAEPAVEAKAAVPAKPAYPKSDKATDWKKPEPAKPVVPAAEFKPAYPSYTDHPNPNKPTKA